MIYLSYTVLWCKHKPLDFLLIWPNFLDFFFIHRKENNWKRSLCMIKDFFFLYLSILSFMEWARLNFRRQFHKLKMRVQKLDYFDITNIGHIWMKIIIWPPSPQYLLILDDSFIVIKYDEDNYDYSSCEVACKINFVC